MYLSFTEEVDHTMKQRLAVGALAVALCVSSALAADALKSGPQVGDSVGAFDVLNLNGPAVDKKNCLV